VLKGWKLGEDGAARRPGAVVCCPEAFEDLPGVCAGQESRLEVVAGGGGHLEFGSQAVQPVLEAADFSFRRFVVVQLAPRELYWECVMTSRIRAL